MIRLSGQIAPEMGEWECMECGYIEEGTKGRRPKKCPECGASASTLEFFPAEDDAELGRAVHEEYEDKDLEEYVEDETALYEEEFEGEEQ